MEQFTHIDYKMIAEEDKLKTLKAPTLGNQKSDLTKRLNLLKRVLAKAVLSGDYLLREDNYNFPKTFTPELIGCLIQALQECQQEICFKGCKSANERTKWVEAMKYNLLTDSVLKDALERYLDVEKEDNGYHRIGKLSASVSQSLNKNHIDAGAMTHMIALERMGDQEKLEAQSEFLTYSTNQALSRKIITNIPGGRNQTHKLSLDACIEHMKSVCSRVAYIEPTSKNTSPKNYISTLFLQPITIDDNTTVTLSQKQATSRNFSVEFKGTDTLCTVKENDGKFHCNTDGNNLITDASLYLEYQALAVAMCNRYYTDDPKRTLEFDISTLHHSSLKIKGKQIPVLDIIKDTCKKTIESIETREKVAEEDRCKINITGPAIPKQTQSSTPKPGQSGG